MQQAFGPRDEILRKVFVATVSADERVNVEA
jgi:hypothetical protein